jgi:hypothetical protein
MQLMDDDLVRLVVEWQIDLQDASAQARDFNHFRDGLINAWISI